MAMKVLVAGGGRVGGYLARLLQSGGHEVRVVEMREERIRALRADLPGGNVVGGNATDPVVLEKAGVREADVVAAVTGQDETNLVVTSLARFEFRSPRTIARVKDPRNAWMFTPEMGVDVALNQADLLARLVAEEMSLGDMMTLLKLRRGQVSLVEEKVHPTAAAAGRALGTLAVPEGCVVVAILRGGRVFPPRADTVLEAADEVLAVAHAGQAVRLAALLGPAGEGEKGKRPGHVPHRGDM